MALAYEIDSKLKALTPILDESMGIDCSTQYSKAYLHHLFKVQEMLALQIVAQHNVAVMTRLMREVRAAIRAGTLDQLQQEWLPE